ncbi:hypothetical protein VSR01_15715 [Actinacidiphila sp. DG2A-62]|uniref:hypothetical protein n=1 Tax=Actinacidiphila sp. DG2A-62 TaxID=3108821 RepID=UPI002DB63FC0|nr:hypothetical protein [Actinacidiphila sp. DG2A-62]MEC3994898.1 hypothetical protein [Actinacidiphila sp. DG2A-62]
MGLLHCFRDTGCLVGRWLVTARSSGDHAQDRHAVFVIRRQEHAFRSRVPKAQGSGLAGVTVGVEPHLHQDGAALAVVSRGENAGVAGVVVAGEIQVPPATGGREQDRNSVEPRRRR